MESSKYIERTQVITPKSWARCLLGTDRPEREGKERKPWFSGRRYEQFPGIQVWLWDVMHPGGFWGLEPGSMRPLAPENRKLVRYRQMF